MARPLTVGQLARATGSWSRSWGQQRAFDGIPANARTALRWHQTDVRCMFF
jgi:hypothetical protein